MDSRFALFVVATVVVGAAVFVAGPVGLIVAGLALLAVGSLAEVLRWPGERGTTDGDEPVDGGELTGE